MAIAAPLITVLGAVVFSGLVAGLHTVRPRLEPARHMISEYARGPRGWMMRSAFYALAAACASLAWAVWPQGRAAAVVLALAAAGAAGAGLFVTDPPGGGPSTPPGRLNVLFSFVFIPLFPVAATLTAAVPHAGGPALAVLAALGWVGFAAFLGTPLYLGAVRGVADPPAGYAQRCMVLTYVVFLVVAGVRLGRL